MDSRSSCRNLMLNLPRKACTWREGPQPSWVSHTIAQLRRAFAHQAFFQQGSKLIAAPACSCSPCGNKRAAKNIDLHLRARSDATLRASCSHEEQRNSVCWRLRRQGELLPSNSQGYLASWIHARSVTRRLCCSFCHALNLNAAGPETEDAINDAEDDAARGQDSRTDHLEDVDPGPGKPWKVF